MKRLVLTACFALITACTPSIQTTSGQSYVLATGPDMIDPEIARAAAVEPNLQFPARIGIARIVNGALTVPPQSETDLFRAAAERHAALGTFVPVSPLIAAMMQGPRHNYQARTQSIIRDLRLASARQHLDYLIIYELGASSRTENTPFALADVTLLGGMLLPTRNVEVAGLGTAAFIDVRNGYPYATVQATTDLSGFARTFQSYQRSEALRSEATERVAAALIPKIEEMLSLLMQQ